MNNWKSHRPYGDEGSMRTHIQQNNTQLIPLTGQHTNQHHLKWDSWIWNTVKLAKFKTEAQRHPVLKRESRIRLQIETYWPFREDSVAENIMLQGERPYAEKGNAHLDPDPEKILHTCLTSDTRVVSLTCEYPFDFSGTTHTYKVKNMHKSLKYPVLKPFAYIFQNQDHI